MAPMKLRVVPKVCLPPLMALFSWNEGALVRANDTSRRCISIQTVWIYLCFRFASTGRDTLLVKSVFCPCVFYRLRLYNIKWVSRNVDISSLWVVRKGCVQKNGRLYSSLTRIRKIKEVRSYNLTRANPTILPLRMHGTVYTYFITSTFKEVAVTFGSLQFT